MPYGDPANLIRCIQVPSCSSSRSSSRQATCSSHLRIWFQDRRLAVYVPVSVHSTGRLAVLHTSRKLWSAIIIAPIGLWRASLSARSSAPAGRPSQAIIGRVGEVVSGSHAFPGRTRRTARRMSNRGLRGVQAVAWLRAVAMETLPNFFWYTYNAWAHLRFLVLHGPGHSAIGDAV